MKNVLLSFILFFSLFELQAQTLLWESMPGAGIRNNPAVEDALNSSNLSPTNFDNDDFADVLTISIFSDTFPPFLINTKNGEYIWQMPGSFSFQDIVFLGFSSDPMIPDQGDPDFNQLLFGLKRNDRIIGILIANKLTSSDDFEITELDIGANFVFLSADDFNNDEVTEFFLFNADERRVQLWRY